MLQHLAVHQDFAGRVAAQLGNDLVVQLFRRQFRGMNFTGGNIRKADAGGLAFYKHATQIVVPVILQHTAFNDRTGGHYPDDVPLYQALGLGRVLHLLADGHLVTLGDQTGHIAFIAVERYPAHGGPLFLSAVPPGQGQFQFLGCQNCIVVEHLIEIPQTEKENFILVLLFDLKILCHHGRKFSHTSHPDSLQFVSSLGLKGPHAAPQKPWKAGTLQRAPGRCVAETLSAALLFFLAAVA